MTCRLIFFPTSSEFWFVGCVQNERKAPAFAAWFGMGIVPCVSAEIL